MQILNPWLIQRGSPYSAERRAEATTVSQAVNMDYMGSSEFEYGALPKCLREMEAQAASMPETLTVRPIPGIHDRDGNPLLAVGLTAAALETYAGKIAEVVGGKRIKERTSFEDAVTPIADLPSYHGLRRDPPKGHRREPKRSLWLADQRARMTGFWWDIDNGVMMTFDAALAADLPRLLQGSWARLRENAEKARAEKAAALA